VSSIPAESMLSVAGFVRNLQRSPISPHRLNRVCFVHDNYAKLFRLNNNNKITIIVLFVMHDSRHDGDSQFDDITNHAVRCCGAIDEHCIGL